MGNQSTRQRNCSESDLYADSERETARLDSSGTNSPGLSHNYSVCSSPVSGGYRLERPKGRLSEAFNNLRRHSQQVSFSNFGRYLMRNRSRE